MSRTSLVQKVLVALAAIGVALTLQGCGPEAPRIGEPCDPAVDGSFTESAAGKQIFCNTAYPRNGQPGSWFLPAGQ